jgi:hypothetical protein
MTRFVVTATSVMVWMGESADLTGAAARTGPGAGTIAIPSPKSAIKVQVFAVISLMGEETTLKSGVSSLHARDTA